MSCPSTWLLERYHLGYLADAMHRDTSHHIEQCELCQAWLHDVESVALPPLDWSAASHVEVAQETSPGWWEQWIEWFFVGRGPVWAGGMAAFLFCVVMWQGALVTPDRLSYTPTPYIAQNTWRNKGQSSWEIYALRFRSQQVVKLPKSSPQMPLAKRPQLHTKDALRFHFELNRKMQVMVVSINQVGAVSLYYPYPSQVSVSLEAGPHKLPKANAIPLDGYVGAELFVVLANEKPFSYQNVKRQLREQFQREGAQLQKLKPLSGFVWQDVRLMQKVR